MAVSISPPDVDLLLDHYKLTEDVYSQQVSAVHLEEISRSHCKDWRKLPAHLDLPEIMASDIDRKQREESEKRKEFFSGWQERKGFAATYKSLISALLKIDCRQDAESVCKLLQESLVTATHKTSPGDQAISNQATQSKDKEGCRFPYLNTENMTEEEKKRLITRLERESAKMINKFATLVDKTRESLEKQEILPKDLITLIQHSEKNNLTNLFQENADIRNLFSQLKEYWSFFNYELLALIIERHFSELKPNLDDYVAHFKSFCKRRICELPADIFKTKKKHNNSVHIKYDGKFGDLTLMDVKDNLEHDLSVLLDTEVYLLSIQEGCVELEFEPLCDIQEVFPLNSEQLEQFCKMGVTQIKYGELHLKVTHPAIDQVVASADPKSGQAIALEPECVHSASQNDVLCMICHGVMQNPFLATCCQKSFCESCINKHREKSSRCPHCNFDDFNLVLNRNLRDVIDSQLVYCSYKSEGCSWSGERGTFERHLKESCDCHMIECDYGCGEKYLRREKKNHFASNVCCIEAMEKRLKELTQSSENRVEELESLARFQHSQVQDLQGQKQVLVGKLQKLIEDKKIMSKFFFGLLVLSAFIFGYMYLHYDVCPPLKPKPLQGNKTPHITTEIAKFVALESADLSFTWQLDIEDYWGFELFAAGVKKINGTHISINYGARISPVRFGSLFKASVIVQVFNPEGTDHHVSRMDVIFETKTADKSWYTTEFVTLMDLTGSNKMFYPGPDSSLKLRIVNVEVGTNSIWPYHFSMCHFKYYQVHDEQEWNTFPFYIHGYKFMIYIHANGYGASEGKALTLTAYRMKGERDDMIPEEMKSGNITIKIRKKDGDHARKRLAITGRAREIVEDGIEVDFQKNSRFPQFGYRSEYGASLDIPHSELDKYVDEDCLIFDIYLADAQ